MNRKGWERVELDVADMPVMAVAPVIISASRSTDIPAFYKDWFLYRLERGYVKWKNPYSGADQYVSLEKARLFVFWSKNPAPFIPCLEILDSRGLGYYFLFTLNNYEPEGLEPGIPPLEERICTFIRLSERVGRGRAVWRFDPLLLAPGLSVKGLLDRIAGIGDRIAGHTSRLVISFIDIDRYAKVRRNLKASGFPGVRQFSLTEMEELACGLQDLNKEWNLDISACGEALNLSMYGTGKGGCVNYDLIMEEFAHDPLLMEFLGLPGGDPGRMKKALKDPGQRYACRCIMSKDIGQYDTCIHQCRYCYANSSPGTAMKNFEQYQQKKSQGCYGDSIVPFP